jgi:hypothetical protein
MKTTFTDKVMRKIANLTEKGLVEKGIFHKRVGTIFSVMPQDLDKLSNAQLNANRQLIEDGVITQKMMERELKANFGL